MTETTTPELGQAVEIEIADGLVVRHERTARKLETGDRVTWSTYYARRARDGALRVAATAEVETREPVAPLEVPDE